MLIVRKKHADLFVVKLFFTSTIYRKYLCLSFWLYLAFLSLQYLGSTATLA